MILFFTEAIQLESMQAYNWPIAKQYLPPPQFSRNNLKRCLNLFKEMCKTLGFALATVVATRQPSSKKLQLQNFLHNQLFLYCSQGGGAEHRTGCICLVKSRALVMNLSGHCWNLHQQIGQTLLFPRCKVIHMDFFLMLYSHKVT